MSVVVHEVGEAMVLGSTVVQLCTRCGAVVDEADVRNVSTTRGADLSYPTWPVGALVLVAGGFRMTIDESALDETTPMCSGSSS